MKIVELPILPKKKKKSMLYLPEHIAVLTNPDRTTLANISTNELFDSVFGQKLECIRVRAHQP